MIKLFVRNETAPLESVVLGIGIDRGQPRAINPVMRQHLKNNTFPSTENICAEIKTFEEVLLQNGVTVHRPSNLSETEQIFSRDIGFVIDDRFFIANMKHPVRGTEIAGIQHLLDQIAPEQIITIPAEITVEGGDVIVWNDHVFIGLSDRTSRGAVAFIQSVFPHKKVVGVELVVDQESPDNNILHLDCTFQPIGKEEAIIYQAGFAQPPTVLLDLFPPDKRIDLSLEEKNQMFPNIFSISPTKVAIERGFTRLRQALEKRGYVVYEVDYAETSKLGGLLRCSTLPLRRGEG